MANYDVAVKTEHFRCRREVGAAARVMLLRCFLEGAAGLRVTSKDQRSQAGSGSLLSWWAGNAEGLPCGSPSFANGGITRELDLAQVIAVKVHNLVPRAYEVLHED